MAYRVWRTFPQEVSSPVFAPVRSPAHVPLLVAEEHSKSDHLFDADRGLDVLTGRGCNADGIVIHADIAICAGIAVIIVSTNGRAAPVLQCAR